MAPWLLRWFTYLATALTLSGCAVIVTSPITIPVWFALGVLFVVNPTTRSLWSGCSAIMALLFGFMACFGLTAVLIGFPTSPLIRFVSVLTGGAGLLVWYTRRLSDNAAQAQGTRLTRVGLQVLTGVAVVGGWYLLLARL